MRCRRLRFVLHRSLRAPGLPGRPGLFRGYAARRASSGITCGMQAAGRRRSDLFQIFLNKISVYRRNPHFINLITRPALRQPCPRWGRGRVRFLCITCFWKSRYGCTDNRRHRNRGAPAARARPQMRLSHKVDETSITNGGQGDAPLGLLPLWGREGVTLPIAVAYM